MRESFTESMCLSRVKWMSSCCSADISHLSWWEWGRAVSKPRLLQRLFLIRKVGRSYIFSSRPRLHTALNEFLLLCVKQTHTERKC